MKRRMRQRVRSKKQPEDYGVYVVLFDHASGRIVGAIVGHNTQQTGLSRKRKGTT